MFIASSTVTHETLAPWASRHQPQHLARLRRLGGQALAGGTLFVPRTQANGFDVTMHLGSGGVFAKFGGLIQDFEDLGTALDWTERCFADTYRLRVDYLGNRPYQWTLERLLPSGGIIETLSSGYPVIFPWLRRKHSLYLQNENTPTSRHISVVDIAAAVTKKIN